MNNMNTFEIVKRFQDDKYIQINLPKRATGCAAGYDFEVAENTIVPSYLKIMRKWEQDSKGEINSTDYFDLSEIAAMTKETKIKPTLVPTGIKCHLENDCYLELSVRSSLPLKHWLILANGVGIIDADYYGNEDNDGEIMFQLINLSPFDIILHKGDRIGQGIIRQYGLIETDKYGLGSARKGGFGSTSLDIDNPFNNTNYVYKTESNSNGSTTIAIYPKEWNINQETSTPYVTSEWFE